MGTALPLLLSCALAAEGHLDLGLRSDGRARWVTPAAPADRRTLDVAASPTLDLGIRSRATTFGASYRPSLTLRDLGQDQARAELHEGTLRLSVAPGAPLRFDLSATGVAGRTDQVTLNRSATTPSGSQAITDAGPIDVRSLRTDAGLRLALDARNEASLSVGGAWSDGADARSRLSMPLARSVEAGLAYGWRAAPREQLTVSLTGELGEVPAQRTTSGATTLQAGWRWNATPALVLAAAGGAVGYFSAIAPADSAEGHRVSREVRPAGTLKAEYARRALTAGFDGRLGASMDRTSGLTTQQVGASFALGWKATRALALQARGSGSRSWARPGRTDWAGVELGASVRVSTATALTVGAYGAWQDSTLPAAVDFSEYGLSLGFAIRAPTTRF